MRRLLFTAGVCLALNATGALGADDNPHAFMADAAQCGRCHEEEAGAPSAVTLTKDVVSLCLDCHGSRELFTVHPVDIRPAVAVPVDLPLDSSGTMTCATCHDAHGPYRGEGPYVAEPLHLRLLAAVTFKSSYRTYFLRRRNDAGALCLGCHQQSLLAAEGFHVDEVSLLPEYAGSAACSTCHPDAYREWRRTSHARMAAAVADAPELVAADFDTDPPFPFEQVVYRLGNHWTQRFVVKKEDSYYVKAPIWSLTKGEWDTSYWIDKPWTEYCQGCHTTGFEVRPEARFAELGIGCEACHGPGRRHVESNGEEAVVNPADLDPARRAMVCEACHTVGHDRTGQFRFPLGYLPGKDLTRYYKGLLPKPGQDNNTFLGDESYADRHNQWQFWVEHFMDAKGLTCDLCKSFRDRATKTAEQPVMNPSEYCLSCHQKDWPETRLHRRHLEAEVHCHRCHVPGLAPGGKSYSVHDHKFLFLEPETEVNLTLEEACSQCHDGGVGVRRN
ncbi:MAG: multiheme c-type cytochrome [Deferrisomatales bacterium]|nr:multiheme c-type cytochrome [Deferrisomatales bacterium]